MKNNSINVSNTFVIRCQFLFRVHFFLSHEQKNYSYEYTLICIESVTICLAKPLKIISGLYLVSFRSVKNEHVINKVQCQRKTKAV